MRLLNGLDDGSFELTENLEDDDLPPYAILSHTWGPNEEEVTYQDLANGAGKDKKGYGKLEFCEKRARHDGQKYFWVDTCCIDKTNSVELNTAITSMFQWYAKATKCYVYLPDVVRGSSGKGNDDDAGWQAEFRSCRWLTRGWTLQELLAPRMVEFYDRDGVLLGDKATLESHICEITGVPAAAVRGRDLSSFGIPERLSWQRARKTKKPEDAAYSLSGICGVSMIPVYGEGKDRAMARLRKEIDDLQKGPKRDDFSIPFGDTRMIGVEKFIAREQELQDIHAALNSDGTRRTVVLHGLGGIGKTQLAIAYAKRHKDDYSASFWLNMQDTTTGKQSLVQFAKRVLRHHPSAPHLGSVNLSGSVDEVAAAVLAWLGMPENTRWLAICDNYDNPKIPGNDDPAAVDIRDFLPEEYQGSVIVTTRSSQVRIGRNLPMQKLTEVQESVEILSNMSRRTLSAEDPDVQALVRTLDGLPLALATTGSYLHQVTVSIAEYLKMYQSSWAQLHEDDPGLDTYDDRTLYSTWRVSLDHIERRNELSARLLELWCYFGNQDLWYELVRAGPTEDLPWLARLTEDLTSFTKAMRFLCSYGLVDSGMTSGDAANSGGYSIHACVHSWSVHVLNREWNDTLAAFAVEAIGNLVPHKDDPIEPWVTQRRLLPHAERCFAYLRGMASERGRIENAFFNFGHLYQDFGGWEKAGELFTLALHQYEEKLGLEHILTLSTISNLGVLYGKQGKLQEAEEMYLRALRGYEKAVGLGHLSTLSTTNNLGVLYTKQGKLQEAQEMTLRALRGCEKAVGLEHPSTFDINNNLGVLYKEQGKLQEAEEVYLRVLRGYEKAWGLEHPSTLNTINNLGLLYKEQGNLEEAEEMYLRVLRGYEKAWGLEHPSTFDTINNLGLLYSEQGKLQEAEEMYLHALRGKEKAVGLEHPSIFGTINNLGVLYREQGKLQEAEEMYLRALRGYETVLGPKHVFTVDAVSNLTLLYKAQDRAKEAKIMCLRAMEGYKQVEGDHEATVGFLQEMLAELELDRASEQELRQAPDASTVHPEERQLGRGKMRKRDRFRAMFYGT